MSENVVASFGTEEDLSSSECVSTLGSRWPAALVLEIDVSNPSVKGFNRSSKVSFVSCGFRLLGFSSPGCRDSIVCFDRTSATLWSCR